MKKLMLALATALPMIVFPETNAVSRAETVTHEELEAVRMELLDARKASPGRLPARDKYELKGGEIVLSESSYRRKHITRLTEIHQELTLIRQLLEERENRELRKLLQGAQQSPGATCEQKANGTMVGVQKAKTVGAVTQGIVTSPEPTKGVSAHPDYYDYPDKQAHPTDPKIVFPDWQRYYDMPNAYSEGQLVAEHVPPARLTGADNTTPVGWERGKTAYKNGHAVDADHPAVGISMTVVTHMRQMTVNGAAKYQVMFSRMEFDENGLLVRVVPCSNWYTMM